MNPYIGAEDELAENIGQALASIQGILEALVMDAQLDDNRRVFYRRDLDHIEKIAGWLDPSLAPPLARWQEGAEVLDAFRPNG